MSICDCNEILNYSLFFELETRVFELVQSLGYNDLSNEVLIELLLYGDKDLPNNLNKNIIKLTPIHSHNW